MPLTYFPVSTPTTSTPSVRQSANGLSENCATASDGTFAYINDSGYLILITGNGAGSNGRYVTYSNTAYTSSALQFDKNDNLYHVSSTGQYSVVVNKFAKPSIGWKATVVNNNGASLGVAATLTSTITLSYGDGNANWYGAKLMYTNDGTNEYMVFGRIAANRGTGTAFCPWQMVSFELTTLTKKDEMYYEAGSPRILSAGTTAFGTMTYFDGIHLLQPKWGATNGWNILWRDGNGSYARWLHGWSITATGTFTGFVAEGGSGNGVGQYYNNMNSAAIIPLDGVNKFLMSVSDSGYPYYWVATLPLNSGTTYSAGNYSYLQSYVSGWGTVSTAQGSSRYAAPFMQYISATKTIRFWGTGNDTNLRLAEIKWDGANDFTYPNSASTVIIAGMLPAITNSASYFYSRGPALPRTPKDASFVWYQPYGYAGWEDIAVDGLYSPVALTSPAGATVNMTPGVKAPLTYTKNATFNLYWGENAFTTSTWKTYKLKRVYGATTDYWNASTSTWGATEVSNTWTSFVTLNAAQFTNGTSYSLYVAINDDIDETAYGTAKTFTPVAATSAPASPTPRRMINATVYAGSDAHLFTVDNRTLINKVTLANTGSTSATVTFKLAGTVILAPTTLTANQTLTYETSQLALANEVASITSTADGVDVYVTGTEGI